MDDKKDKKNNKEAKKVDQLDWHDRYLRALADYHNLEKRANQQISQAVSQANQRLILQLIDLLDDIEQAELFINDKGLVLIKNKLEKILTNENVNPIELINKEYDPSVAECIEIISDNDNNIVKEVVKKGYQLNGTLLRPGQVKVGKKM